jgi:hypothetical protein
MGEGWDFRLLSRSCRTMRPQDYGTTRLRRFSNLGGRPALSLARKPQPYLKEFRFCPIHIHFLAKGRFFILILLRFVPILQDLWLLHN